MIDRIRSRLTTLRERPSTRATVLEAGPLMACLLLVSAKLALFSLPPWYHPELAWNGWIGWREFLDAAQATAGSLSTLLLLFAPLVLLSPVRRYGALWALNLAITLMVVADFVHFRYFGDVISVASTSAGWQVGLIVESVLELLQPADGLFFADLALALAVAPAYARAVRRSPVAAPRARLRRASVRMALAGLAILLLVPARIVALDSDETFHFSYLRFFGVQKIGLLNYHAYEAGERYAGTLLAGEAVSQEEAERALGFVAARRPAATAPSPLFGVADGRNVLFVMLESFQAFPIGLRVEGQELTPTLNALAARSLYFDNFYEQAWEGQTSDGEFTSLQSLHPLPAGAVATTYPDHRYRALPRILRERGYTTVSAHAYHGDLWRMRDMHPGLGFQRSFFRESYRVEEKIGMGLPDAEFFRQTTPMLESLPRPFMAYLMTLTTHHPYELPASHRKLRLGELEGTLLGNYLHSVHYVDAALGELIEQLKCDGLWEETVVVLYGDHKGKLGDPGDLERLLTRHAGFPSRAAGLDPRYWREEHRVPLLIHLPGDAAAGRHSASGGHLDIAPTVLNLLGIRDHGMVTLGRDLTRGDDDLVVFRNGSFILADTLCVVPGIGGSAKACHDLRRGEQLDAARFASRFAEARERLAVSDAILHGDLIPER